MALQQESIMRSVFAIILVLAASRLHQFLKLKRVKYIFIDTIKMGKGSYFIEHMTINILRKPV